MGGAWGVHGGSPHTWGRVPKGVHEGRGPPFAREGQVALPLPPGQRAARRSFAASSSVSGTLAWLPFISR